MARGGADEPPSKKARSEAVKKVVADERTRPAMIRPPLLPLMAEKAPADRHAPRSSAGLEGRGFIRGSARHLHDQKASSGGGNRVHCAREAMAGQEGSALKREEDEEEEEALFLEHFDAVAQAWYDVTPLALEGDKLGIKFDEEGDAMTWVDASSVRTLSVPMENAHELEH